MSGTHLTPRDLEQYVMGESEENAQAAIARHLADCAACRMRADRTEKLERAIHAMGRANVPSDLTDRIVAAVDWRVALEERVRRRLPWMIFATAASFVVSIWLVVRTGIALEDEGALEFLSLYSSRPDLISTYFNDALFALVETLPLQELALTVIAIAIAIILAQQLAESLRPRAAH